MDRLHPHALVGAFVHNYEAIIFPHLRKDDASTPYPAMLDAIDRSREVRKIAEGVDYNPWALAYYDGAMMELGALVHEVGRKAAPEVIGHFIATLDRHVSDIELTLSRDKLYQQYRHPPSPD